MRERSDSLRCAALMTAVSGGTSWRRLPNLTLLSRTTGAARGRNTRAQIEPLLSPTGSSQFGTPGSVTATTARHTPSAAMTAW
jgi:hypothetical protein